MHWCRSQRLRFLSNRMCKFSFSLNSNRYLHCCSSFWDNATWSRVNLIVHKLVFCYMQHTFIQRINFIQVSIFFLGTRYKQCIVHCPKIAAARWSSFTQTTKCFIYCKTDNWQMCEANKSFDEWRSPSQLFWRRCSFHCPCEQVCKLKLLLILSKFKPMFPSRTP